MNWVTTRCFIPARAVQAGSGYSQITTCPPDTEKRMVDEIRMTNVLLQTLDGCSTRTFAYPCGDTTAGDSSYIDDIKDIFPAARGVEGSISRIEEVDLYNTDTYVINSQSGDALIGLVKQAMSQNGLVVFLFQGVGGGHSLNVSLEAHRQLLQFLKQQEGHLWIAPMIDISAHVSNYQTEGNGT
ncbi:MAG: hypothetical protein U5K69_11075 [Balneolaceae bacterium]|nr:hypothetical protein [Balneolaceae bacterium]